MKGSGVFVIAGKDLRNLFMSPLFYVVGGICSLLWSILFVVTVIEFRDQQIVSMQQGTAGPDGLPVHFVLFWRHFSLVNFVMIFAAAALTMRLFTEEKRNRTFDLLLTAPVTATEITLGKLLAGTLTVWALIVIAFIYPASLAVFGSLEWGPLASSFIGILLLVATYVAIGMFASSLTQSAVISVILGLIFNVMIWFVGAAAEASNDPSARAVYEHLNIGNHLQNFLKGSVSLASLAFFASAIFLFTFLTQRVVESSRWR